jgi:dipeptidyl aminopeptidase/acylaminoacyl peptidase
MRKMFRGDIKSSALHSVHSLQLIIRLLIVILVTASDVMAQSTGANNDYIEMPEDIYIEGVPPISSQLVADIKPYTISRFSYLQDRNAAKNEILIHSKLCNTMQAYTVSSPGGMRKQVTFYEDPVAASLFDPKDSRYILVQKDHKGDEFYQIYRHDLRSGKDVMLTEGGTTSNFSFRFNHRGDKFYFHSTTKGQAGIAVYFADPNIPGSGRPIPNLEKQNWTIQGISRDDRKLLLSASGILWMYDMNSQIKTQLLPAKGTTGSYFGIAFNKSDDGVYLLTNQESEFAQLAFYDFKTQRLKMLTNFNWDVRTATLSPDGSKIAFTVNIAGNIQAYIFDTFTGKYEAITGLPISFLGGMKWSNNSELLAFQLSTSNANSDIYEWNSKTGKIALWVQNEIGAIDASVIPAPQFVKWKSFDGLEISGFLYPANKRFSGRRPVIIDIHGGPVAQSLPLFDNRTNYYTNELGISVIYPNVRGSDGFGKAFIELDNGMKKENAVKDVGALLAWISEQPDLDAGRVMVTGGSYGGYMTYRTTIEYNQKIRCAVAAFGPSDLMSFKKGVDTPYLEYFRHEYGDYHNSDVVEYFDKISPLKNATRITAPMFIVQGKNDARVPYTESQQIVEAIRNKGGAVWFLLANNEGHGFERDENEHYLFYATVEFIKRYLLN